MNINRFSKIIVILCFGILVSQSSHAQENYVSGYVINTKQDTINGYIDYRNWENNPNKINFKKTAQDQVLTYSVNSIAGFGTKSEQYISATVDSEISPDKTNVLQDYPDINTKTVTTFLRVLYQGDKSLYTYKDSDGKVNFYIKQNGEYKLLIYKKYKKRDTKYKYSFNIAENKKFLGQLKLYLTTCSNLNSRLQNTTYTEQSIENLFNFYYQCTSTTSDYSSKKESVKIKTGILAGVSLSTLNLGSFNNTYPHYNQSINPSIGLFLELVLPRNQGKWSIENELLVTSSSFNGEYKDVTNTNQYKTITSNLKFSYIKLNNLLRYTYPIGKAFMFFNAGISNGLIISETNYKKTESVFYTDTTIVEGQTLNGTRKHEQGLVFGVGSKFNAYSFEARFETGNGMSDTVSTSSKTSRIYLLFGYRF